MDVYLMIRRKKLTIFTDAKETTTVLQLKKMIQGITKHAPENQQLFNKDSIEMEDARQLMEYGITANAAKAQSPGQVNLAVRDENGQFESLDITPYSSPPDLPDVMKVQEPNGSDVSHDVRGLPPANCIVNQVILKSGIMLPVPSENRGLSLEDNFSELLVWRRRTPKFTTFRVNSLTTNPLHFLEILKKALLKLSEDRALTGSDSALPVVWQHPLIPEAVAFGCWNRSGDLPRYELEVIVDCACGAAVLRGAHVFVPGVIGLLPGACEGDLVSIYADVGGVSKRGWTQKLEEKYRFFVGNGVLLLGRKQIFCENGTSRGIAVLVTDNEPGCPSLPENVFTPGMGVMQNLPSIVCGRVVDPQPGEIILDMCAAPGNKTTHLSALMNNEGTIIALDRSASRVSKLRQICTDMSVRNVTAFVFNSIKAVNLEEASGGGDNYDYTLLKNGPPYPPCIFDKILLDAPCSGLGQRPKLEKIDMKHVASFPPLQKKLFETAVSLLKPGGILVYSTCTVAVAENEGVVRWALDHFPGLTLLPAEPRFHPSASQSASSNILSSTELSCIQKFVPSVDTDVKDNICERDTIGFFIARFLKSKTV